VQQALDLSIGSSFILLFYRKYMVSRVDDYAKTKFPSAGEGNLTFPNGLVISKTYGSHNRRLLFA
jgi:hypothetical protein